VNILADEIGVSVRNIETLQRKAKVENASGNPVNARPAQKTPARAGARPATSRNDIDSFEEEPF